RRVGNDVATGRLRADVQRRKVDLRRGRDPLADGTGPHRPPAVHRAEVMAEQHLLTGARRRRYDGETNDHSCCGGEPTHCDSHGLDTPVKTKRTSTAEGGCGEDD